MDTWKYIYNYYSLDPYINDKGYIRLRNTKWGDRYTWYSIGWFEGSEPVVSRFKDLYSFLYSNFSSVNYSV